MEPQDLSQKIKSYINKETLYHRVWVAEVVDINDPALSGRVKCKILNLGWTEAESQPWVNPVRPIQVPEVGDFIQVFFRDGDDNRPYYTGKDTQLEGGIPTWWQGQTTLQEIFTDETTGTYIAYDAENKKLQIKPGEGVTVEIGAATEQSVKGTTFKPEFKKNIDMLTELKTAFNNWVPVPNDGGAALKTALATFLTLIPGDDSNILSERIKIE